MSRPWIIVIVAMCGTVTSVAQGNLGRQLFELVASSPVSNSDFGDAVAISDSWIVVGAEDTLVGGVPNSGAVYVYSVTTGAQHSVLTVSPPASRQFGNAVAVFGNRVLAGAEDENGVRGAAYLFDVNGTQLFRFQASNPTPNAEFGHSVALSGSRALIGAPGASGFTGAVYLFDTLAGTQIAGPLQPTGLPVAAEFGDSLDLDGDLAVVGLSGGDLGGPVFVYNLNDLANPLRIEPPLDPSTLQPIPGFGRRVGISGQRLLIGATPGTDAVNGEFGRAYIYDALTGLMLHELRPNDSQSEDLFGEAVAIDGNLAIVAARREPFLGLVNKTYLFDVTTGRQLASFIGDQVRAGDEAAEAIALRRGRAVVGVESFDSPGFINNGVALVFDVLVGDYNKNAALTCEDVDLLVDAIARGTHEVRFDITGDGLVDASDLQSWLVNAGAINLPSGEPYRSGDANLDGTVNQADFAVWNSHKFTNRAAWCSGDFNADGRIDGVDFGHWNANKQPVSEIAASPVPELSTGSLSGALALAWSVILSRSFQDFGLRNRRRRTIT